MLARACAALALIAVAGRAPAGETAASAPADRVRATGPAALVDTLAAPPDSAIARHAIAATESLATRADSVAAALADSLRAADSLALAAHALPFAGARGPDQRDLRLELGGSTDVTNEIFYEDVLDTTYRVIGRTTVSTPETRVAAVLLAGLVGTRGSRGTRYELMNDVSLGDKVQRGSTDLYWRQSLAPRWTMLLTPRLEARHDITFGHDLSEWSGGATARLRRALRGPETDAELGLGGDFVRATGSGSDLVPDHVAGTAALDLDHAGPWADWRVGAALARRSYPDSAERDHREWSLSGRWRLGSAEGHWIALEGDGVRRQTIHPAPTTRDNLREGRAVLEGEARGGPTWSLTGRFELDALAYDQPDSALFYDQTLWRGWIAPRMVTWSIASLAAGPRAELLVSPADPGEEYGDLGGAIEFESAGRNSWWRIAPWIGQRTYRVPATRGRYDPVALHTNATFYQLDLIGDQGLGAGLRLRMLLTGRIERHTDPVDDSTSLYFSLDLRRLLSRGRSAAGVATPGAPPGRPES